MSDPSLYARAGGRAALDRLVEAFYEGVPADPVLAPLYPADLGPPARRLAEFLVQLTGGPNDYERSRGPARLRLRHFAFTIDTGARDAWLARMRAALVTAAIPDEVAEELEAYFSTTASFLVNTGLSLRGRAGGSEGDDALDAPSS